jgi:hypothetical protein
VPVSKPPADPRFEEAWALYPKCPNNNKQQARKAWQARLNEGVDPDLMIDGVKAYAAYLKATGSTFIKHAATFFGPAHHFTNDFTLPEQEERGPEGDLLRFYQEERVI